MRIGIPNESYAGQVLVAASPDAVGKLVKLGYTVCVEAGAGKHADFYDESYREAGAEVVDASVAWASDIVICLDTPSDDKLALIKQGATLIARMNPGANPGLVKTLSAMGVTALAMDAVPRISRAQSLDVRSSMMNVAGYRAVIEAANVFGRLFSGQVTAAGKVPPAKVYVIGVGVAGLAAIGTAASMGSIVSATDVRPEVADQVESLGGSFVEIPVKQESSDGYAKEMSDDQQQLVLKVYTEQAAKNDIVITTAQIPGRPSPLLLTEEAVRGMKPGSVIIDMGASEQGSNCALTKPGEVVRTENDVTIVGYTDLPGRLPSQASQLYGQNIVNLFKLVTPEKDGVLQLNEEDEVIRGMTVTLEGEIMWPPPPVKVSAAPQKKEDVAAVAPEAEAAEKPAWKKWWWKIALAVLGVALIMTAPSQMTSHFIVFELAVVVGFYVITSVTHALHTPLMSVTNAISGIIIVGAILLAGSDNPIVAVLSVIAMAIAAINVFGGFLVTHRMLKMFQRSSGNE
ncbi:Re/Si-specific NAD(P)(+) transhydrogenase subunit alpha [Eggerthella sp. YY7918]|uniref:Re/Si-specific NAD(P)(+) transhydrogenase subunit alpha n=1 Tax=Eggerthella sp. (strain YY7918) TaxID=502558 RepID=UPI00021712D5|nr:Re/Si-specific NAD(P)(+) transhydrogenase subunit alpha [Eggerthella sp. YY7918]BAK44764.1 NAD/NADP transhydrogenase alpha subunit [Eggerthella sp. YY7918]